MRTQPLISVRAGFTLGALLSLACSGTDPDTTEPDPVATVALSPANARLEPGQTLKLSPTLRGGTRLVVTGRNVTWTSSNPTVATVESGLVTGIREGAAVITASVDGTSGSARITVQTSVATVGIDPDSPTIAVGTSVQLHARPLGAGGSPIEGPVASWNTSNPRVASVSVGKVRGLRVGTAEITARVDEETGVTTVTVLPNVSGAWTFTMSVSDTSRGISCAATGSLAIEQTGGSLGGTLRRNGSCTGTEPPEISGGLEIRDGALSAGRLDFISGGGVGCSYVAGISGARPVSAAGEVGCTGLAGGSPVVLRGTWEMRR